MPNTKTIRKNEQFNLSFGELRIKSIPGDAHLTTSRIYYNDELIANGEGEVEANTIAQRGDQILIIATINKPQGSSDFASLSIEVNDDGNLDRWDYSSYEPGHDEVIYEVEISLI